MNINRLHVCESTNNTKNHTVSASTIARVLHAGDRMMVDPIGEVYLINRHDGPPEVEFVFDNKFLEAMVDIKIHELERYKQSLQEQ